MENNIKVSSLKNAIKLLKDGVVLIAYPLNVRTIFRYLSGAIQCISEKSSFKINEYEFMEIYNGTDFYIYNNEDELIDEDKDKEYYGWGKLAK